MPELTEQQYFLELWRECGEASTRECRNCPVPLKLCEKWGQEMDDAFVKLALNGVRLG